MEKTTHNIEALFSEAGDYIENKTELFKLKLADKISDVISAAVSGLVIVVISAIFFTFINIGLSLWIGDLTGKVYYGFFIVGGFYALVALIIYISRDKWLKMPVNNMVLKKLFK